MTYTKTKRQLREEELTEVLKYNIDSILSFKQNIPQEERIKAYTVINTLLTKDTLPQKNDLSFVYGLLSYGSQKLLSQRIKHIFQEKKG